MNIWAVCTMVVEKPDRFWPPLIERMAYSACVGLRSDSAVSTVSMSPVAEPPMPFSVVPTVVGSGSASCW